MYCETNQDGVALIIPILLKSGTYVGIERRTERGCLRTAKHLDTVRCTCVRITMSASVKLPRSRNRLNRIDRCTSTDSGDLGSRCCAPQNFRFVAIQLKSTRLHPAVDGTGAGSELRREDFDTSRTARAVDVRVVGI